MIRKFAVIALLLFAFCQTTFVKNGVARKIESALAERGFESRITSFSGMLPFYADLEMEGPIKTVKARMKFGKGWGFSYLKAEGVYKGEAFTLKASGTGRSIKALVFGEAWQLCATGSLKQLEGHLTTLEIPLIQSGLHGHFNWEKQEVEGDFTIAHTRLKARASLEEEIWKGTCQINGDVIDLEGHAQFVFDPVTQLIDFSEIVCSAGDSILSGHITTTAGLDSLEGGIVFHAPSLKPFRPLFPDSFLSGSLGASLTFHPQRGMQEAHFQVEGENLTFKEHFLEAFNAEGILNDLFGTIKGEIAVDARHFISQKLKLETAHLRTQFFEKTAPVQITLKGDWDDPLFVNLSGVWHREKQGVHFSITEFQGTGQNKEFFLKSPFEINWQGPSFSMSSLDLNLGKGSLSGHIDLSPSSSLVKLRGDHLPLEFAQWIHPALDLQGSTSFHTDLFAIGDDLQGNLSLSLFEKTTGSNGNLEIRISQKIAQIQTNVFMGETQMLWASGSIPFSYTPYQFSLDLKRPFSGEITMDGKVEKLLDFFDIGAHRIEGRVLAHLLFSQTLLKPCVLGNIEISDGFYQNDYTGTTLKNISANARADKNRLNIHTFKVTDSSGKGTATGSGLVHLKPKEHFPFQIDAKLKKLEAISSDVLTGRFNGTLQIIGDSNSATAKGSLETAEADFHIPDEMPSSLPDLPITFINKPEELERLPIALPKLYPFYLDLDLIAKQNARVLGKGLNCSLRGKLHLTGTYTDIAAEGSLSLKKGEYLFSGKVFTLDRGEVIFKNHPKPSAFISLSGTCELPDVTATALLRGPLSSPTLSFQSIPQMSLSSLLSQILFNKDLSEISAVQALQVAQTILSLAGGSAPDVLEKVRSALGIDRLTVLTSENDPGKISLQIGKYLIPGVLLTWSQGAQSRNMAVEVDLRRGFSLQAEMNEEQQGKFSLKWRRDY